MKSGGKPGMARALTLIEKRRSAPHRQLKLSDMLETGLRPNWPLRLGFEAEPPYFLLRNLSFVVETK